MDTLKDLPAANDFFSFETRRFVGNSTKTVRTVVAHEGFKAWDLWVAQALAALAKLHDAGYIHGAIDPSALVINEDGNLRLGGLQKVHLAEEALATSDSFAPNNLLLPPEQNMYAAFKNCVPFQTAFHTLQQVNWSMDQLETIFPTIQFTRAAMFGLYETVQSEVKYSAMQRAGDVWMLGFSLLTVYYGWLEWPYALTTEFYQTRHEVFHDLIEQMVRVNPADRIHAAEALAMWAPQEVKMAVTSGATAAAPSVVETSATSVETAAPSVETAVETSAAPSVAETAVAGRRRPYLALQSHPAGRNKTRRSPRS